MYIQGQLMEDVMARRTTTPISGVELGDTVGFKRLVGRSTTQGTVIEVHDDGTVCVTVGNFCEDVVPTRIIRKARW